MYDTRNKDEDCSSGIQCNYDQHVHRYLLRLDAAMFVDHAGDEVGNLLRYDDGDSELAVTAVFWKEFDNREDHTQFKDRTLVFMNFFNIKTRQNEPEWVAIERFIKSGMAETATKFCDWLVKEGYEPPWSYYTAK